MGLSDYELQDPPLGEGSFGVVHRALFRGAQERAVKLFHPHCVDLGKIRRELERISAVKEHPGIVTVYDFDLATDRPYYAMSLHAARDDDGVWHGRTLEARCGKLDRKSFHKTLRELIEAIAYLHSHGVVHCDLKPSNVLLTDEGRIKLCDFGQSRSSTNLVSEIAGTPFYASPEQLVEPSRSEGGRGLRWDVYSFGVLAFKLATGTLPRLQSVADALVAPGASPATADWQTLYEGAGITENQPPDGLPDAAELAQLTLAEGDQIRWPAAGGALLNKEEKALIERCLRLDPDARPPDLVAVKQGWEAISRARQLRRVRLLAFTFASLSILALVGGAFALAQWRQAGLDRDRALTAEQQAILARDKAEDLLEFMIYELRDGLAPIGRLDIVERVQQQVVDYYAQVEDDHTQDDRLQHNRITALTGLGDRLASEGKAEEAAQVYQEALELARQLSAREPDDAQYKRNLTITLNRCGGLLMEQGEVEEALEMFSEALDLSRSLIAGSGENPATAIQVAQDVAIAHEHRGEALHRTGDSVASIEEFQQAAEIARSLVEFRPDDQDLLHNHAHYLQRLGDAHYARGDFDSAGQAYDASFDLLDRLVSSGEEDATLRRSMILALERKADVLAATGRRPEALPFYERLQSLSSELAAEDPRNAKWADAAATGHLKLGEARLWEGEIEGAAEHYDQALKIRQRLTKIDPTNASWQRDTSIVHVKLAELHRQAGNPEAAEEQLRLSEHIYRALVQSEEDNLHLLRNLTIVLNLRGDLAASRGCLPMAKALFEESTSLAEQLVETDPDNMVWRRDLGVCLNRLGDIFSAMGDHFAAAEKHELAVSSAKTVLEDSPHHPSALSDLLFSVNRLAEACAAIAAWDRAAAATRRALDAMQARLGSAQSPSTLDLQLASSVIDLSLVCHQAGDKTLAIDSLSTALTLLADTPENPSDEGEAVLLLSRAALALHKVDPGSARRELLRAKAAAEAFSLSPDPPPWLASTLVELSSILEEAPE